jgi:MFS family permease
MPVLFVAIGVKRMLLIGMLAWVSRYVLFAVAAPGGVMWMILGGIILHGICYDFFFVSGQIYVDKKANPSIRGQAQGLLVFATYGLGMIIGSQVAGRLFNTIVTEEGPQLMMQWRTFWWIPAVFAGAVMVLFGILFNDTLDKKAENTP